MDKSSYIEIKDKLNFKRNVFLNLMIIMIDWILIVVSFIILHINWFGYLLSQFLLAVVFFHNFALVHEASHGNMAKNRKLNDAIGLYASVLCCMPYYPWVFIHMRHHAFAGNVDTDPTAAALKKWRENKRIPFIIRAAWISWIPLAAFAQHLVFLSYPFKILHEKTKLLKSFGSVTFILVSYFVLAYWLPGIFRLQNFALAIVIYLFVEELINLPHHSDLHHHNVRLPLSEQWKATRSCYYPKFLSEFFILNFNFHIEHHLFPSLPWFRLREARGLVKSWLGAKYNECYGFEWNVKNRKHDVQEILL